MKQKPKPMLKNSSKHSVAATQFTEPNQATKNTIIESIYGKLIEPILRVGKKIHSL